MTNSLEDEADEFHDRGKELAQEGKYQEAAVAFGEAASLYETLSLQDDAREAKGLAFAALAIAACEGEDYQGTLKLTAQAIPLLEKVDPTVQLLCRALEHIAQGELRVLGDDLVGAQQDFRRAQECAAQIVKVAPQHVSGATNLAYLALFGELTAGLLLHTLRKEWAEVLANKQQAVEVCQKLSQAALLPQDREWLMGRARGVEGLTALFRGVNLLGRWRLEESEAVFGDASAAFQEARDALARSGTQQPTRRRHFELVQGFKSLGDGYVEYVQALGRLSAGDSPESILHHLVRSRDLCREAQRVFELAGPWGRGMWRAVEESIDAITALEQRVRVATANQDKPSVQGSITLSLADINQLWEAKCGEPLFRFRDPRFFRELFESCDGEADFRAKVNALAGLFDHIDVSVITAHMPTPPKNPGSINALQALLEHWGKDGKALVAPFRTLRSLRKQYPTHADSAEVTEAYRRIGITVPIQDYKLAWNFILQSFESALKDLRTALS